MIANPDEYWSLLRIGAFQGKTPQEARLIKCERKTATRSDIESGTVNMVIGFARLKPAEFVILARFPARWNHLAEKE